MHVQKLSYTIVNITIHLPNVIWPFQWNVFPSLNPMIKKEFLAALFRCHFDLFYGVCTTII